MEKRRAIESEDYDRAKVKKQQMDEYRRLAYEDLHINQLLDSSVVWHFLIINSIWWAIILFHIQLECGPMPNVMVALPNIGGALCSSPQSLADAHY